MARYYKETAHRRSCSLDPAEWAALNSGKIDVIDIHPVGGGTLIRSMSREDIEVLKGLNKVFPVRPNGTRGLPAKYWVIKW